MDAAPPQITKANFLKLVEHPDFNLSIEEASNGRYQDETAIEEPYGLHSRADVPDRVALARPTPKTRLYREIAHLQAQHEAAISQDNRKRWTMLAEEVSDDEWATLWARNGHRENVRWAIGEISAK